MNTKQQTGDAAQQISQQKGCDFHEPFFGASYPDACCIDGALWDLDSGDGDGLTFGGDVPCPKCCHAEWLEYISDEIKDDGYTAAEVGRPREFPTNASIRFEQDGDRAKIEEFWLAGYDEQKQEGGAE